jgi:hypothetical protein
MADARWLLAERGLMTDDRRPMNELPKFLGHRPSVTGHSVQPPSILYVRSTEPGRISGNSALKKGPATG